MSGLAKTKADQYIHVQPTTQTLKALTGNLGSLFWVCSLIFTKLEEIWRGNWGHPESKKKWKTIVMQKDNMNIKYANTKVVLQLQRQK